MKFSDIIPVLETIAPPEYAEEFDTGRIGDIINLDNDIDKIAVALDPTEYVLKRAADIGADLLITHHTLIFEPVTKIAKPLSDKLKIALDNEISLYSMHTNYDKVPGGVNDILADRLGLTNIEELEIGRIGNISPCSIDTFAGHVSKCLDTNVQYVGENKTVEKVMVFGGSGFKSQYLDIAHENGVDAFVSSELKHDVIRNRGGISLVDATHYATENPAMEKLCERLEEMLKLDVEFIDHNPFISVI
ncbi:Nif3-like dinuclear metal center hexameric protein [Methanohalobium sp.]|uniref:Nif3-like dinuclear metal center hexameric protein n=1 Tax=Methanohalobium sp. TaxID=2837493 RepID=UPI0025E05B2D|nr:Nif3-like dinuclear metal center hexameric protein [Methanohalobium sp.]